MINQSFSYWLFSWALAKIAHFYKHSTLCRVFDAVGGFFSNLWANSFVRHILAGDFGLEKGFGSGLVGRVLYKDAEIAANCAAALKPAINQSLILSALRGFFDNLLHISLRSYGLMLLLIGGMPLVYTYLQHGYVGLVLAAIAAAGVALMLLNRSFAQIYNGSWFLQKIGRFFYIKDYGFVEQPKRHYLPLFLLVGAAFGTAATVLELTTFLMLFAGIIGGLLVLYKVEIGVFAVAFLLPIMPTMLVLGLMAVCFVSFFVKVVFTGEIKINYTAMDAFVVIFAAIVGFSLLISFNFAASLPVVLVYILFILFYFVVKNSVGTRRKLLGLVSVVVMSGFTVAAIGVWQRLTGNFIMTEAWLDVDFFDESMVRIYSTLENPNVLGKYLIFVILIAFGMIYYKREKLHKMAAMAMMAVAVLSLVFTQSRGAWLGVIFAMGVFALLRDRRLVVLGIIAIIAAPFFVPPEILGRFLSIGDLGDTSTSFRLSIWLASLDMIRVFWPSGVGLGAETFNEIYNLYAFSAAHALHSHNLYLQIIIDLGIMGFLAFLLFISGFLKGLFVATGDKENSAKRTVAAVLAASMLGYLIMGFTDNVWYNYRVLGFFWLILAMGAALVQTKDWRDNIEKTKI